MAISVRELYLGWWEQEWGILWVEFELEIELGDAKGDTDENKLFLLLFELEDGTHANLIMT